KVGVKNDDREDVTRKGPTTLSRSIRAARSTSHERCARRVRPRGGWPTVADRAWVSHRCETYGHAGRARGRGMSAVRCVEAGTPGTRGFAMTSPCPAIRAPALRLPESRGPACHR